MISKLDKISNWEKQKEIQKIKDNDDNFEKKCQMLK